MPIPRVIGRVLREPLLHFTLLGGAIFFASTAWSTEEETVEAVVADDTTVERIDTELAKKLGRPPTEAERNASIDSFIDAELLYREGLALGLDKDDPVVRRRVIQKMEFVSTNLEVPAKPDDAILRAYLADNAPRYAGPPRRDFTLVTLLRGPGDTDDARAQAALAKLRQGAEPASIGGRLATGRKFSPANAIGTYGPEIGAAIAALPVGEWGLVPFEGGWTLVHLDAQHPGDTPPFEKIRNRVLIDWKASRRGVALRERLDQLRVQYQVPPRN